MFDLSAFVAGRRSERAAAFLRQLRHSQLFEVFINERLALAAEGYPLDPGGDPFEARVAALGPRPAAAALGGRLADAVGGKGRLGAAWRKTADAVKVGGAEERGAFMHTLPLRACCCCCCCCRCCC